MSQPREYGSRYANKRLHLRGAGGKFRKARAEDLGIGGACPVCSHLLLRHYDGDLNERPLDPGKFRYRCFTCEPLHEESKPKEEK